MNAKKFEEWQESLEGVMYELKVLGPTATIVEDKYVRLVAETLLKLPKKVRRKVLDEAYFIVVAGYHGRVEKLHFIMNSEMPVILLNFSEMEKDGLSESRMMDTVAHEIAHFVLGHMVAGGAEREKEADDLIEKWGFRRAYKP